VDQEVKVLVRVGGMISRIAKMSGFADSTRPYMLNYS